MSTDALTQAIITAGDRLAEAVREFRTMENARSVQKFDAMHRLVQHGAVTSLTAAEKYARRDPEYDAFCARQVVAEVELTKARAYYDACTARARLVAADVVLSATERVAA